MLATSNFHQFHQVFENNRSAFDGNLPLQVNSHIARVIARSEVEPAEAEQLVLALQASSIASLTAPSTFPLMQASLVTWGSYVASARRRFGFGSRRS